MCTSLRLTCFGSASDLSCAQLTLNMLPELGKWFMLHRASDHYIQLSSMVFGKHVDTILFQ